MPRKKAPLGFDPATPPTAPIRPSALGVSADPGLPRSRPPKKRNEVDDLRARAARAAFQSKTYVAVNVRLSLDLYRALVELAEEYHEPVTSVTRQCIADGIRKYKDFSTPGMTPFRPHLKRAAVAVAARGNLLDHIARSRPQEPPPSREPLYSGDLPQDEEDQEEQESSQLQLSAETLARFPLAALYPSTPPLPKPQTLPPPSLSETTEEEESE